MCHLTAHFGLGSPCFVIPDEKHMSQLFYSLSRVTSTEQMRVLPRMWDSSHDLQGDTKVAAVPPPSLLVPSLAPRQLCHWVNWVGCQ